MTEPNADRAPPAGPHRYHHWVEAIDDHPDDCPCLHGGRIVDGYGRESPTRLARFGVDARAPAESAAWPWQGPGRPG